MDEGIDFSEQIYEKGKLNPLIIPVNNDLMKILQTEEESVTLSKALGETYALNQILEPFKILQKKCHEFLPYLLKDIIDSRLQEISSYCFDLFEVSKEIQNYKSNHTSFGLNQKSSLIERFKQNANKLIRALEDAQTSVEYKDFKRFSQEVTFKSEQVLKSIEKKKEEAEKLSQIAKQASSTTAGYVSSNYFLEQAIGLEKECNDWLLKFRCISILFIILILFVFAWVYLWRDEFSTVEIIQLGVIKIILFSTMYYLMIYCGNIYKSIKHNVIVNRHRANALQTYEALISIADKSPEIQNAVLLKAADAIFSHQATNFNKLDNNIDLFEKALELVKKSNE